VVRPADLHELAPQGSLRTFRVGAALVGDAIVLRIDEDAAATALDVEARVLDALATAATPPLAPHVLARGRMPSAAGAIEGGQRPFLAYPWIEGSVLDRSSAAARARDVGGAFARLHTTRVMDLHGRLPRTRPLTLLEAFRRSVDELKGWMAARELDGLGQDLLTLALSDLQRALRPFCIAQDHLFLTARRRVLCHGNPAPAFLVVLNDAPPVPPPLCFVGLEHACLGDAAEDLAAFSLAAALDEHAEDALLRAYLEGLEGEGRLDRRFIPRYFARRALALFAHPVARLDAIARMKKGERSDAALLAAATFAAVGDPVAAIEEQARLAYEEIARAMNGLRELGGRARPIGVSEVMSMGRILSVEEMILAESAFCIAVTGQPYVGKTEVASRLARRLKHRFFGTASLSRALALVERDSASTGTALAPRELVTALFARGFVVEPRDEQPFYRARLDDKDITGELHEGGPLHVRGAQLLDDEGVRAAIKDRFAAFPEGVVVEGVYAPALVGGRTFHLSADVGVRRARLFAHRPDVGTEEDAAKLLDRLDESGSPVADVVPVDVGSRTAAAATLEILWHLLPPGRRPQEDLSGRAPL
jgi:Ser/Thr protein kinase RdoA (MazF antagonist)/cytidylate kinase